MGGLEVLRTVLAGSQPDDPTFSAVWAGALSRRRTLLLVLFVLYLAAITSFGFVASTAAFCFASIVILSPTRSLRGMILAAVIAAAVIGLIYLLLVVYLQAFLP
jgi:putative tricarboxylic transport membrane protein